MEKKSISRVEIGLHWTIAIGIIGLISLGIFMSNTRSFSLYDIHKSIGLLVFAIVVVRVLVRLQKGWPENISEGPAWEHGVARVVHWILILGTIIMPLSGMLDAVMSGQGLSIFGLDLIADNPGNNGRPQAIDESMAEMAEEAHQLTGYVLIGAIVLHVAGALKHHLVDGDNTLIRMLGRS
ncbi:cytochrome b [Roseibium sp.]|uniref:cytochrome b n=1 Tax=Roseibium sp. TaxID=1936156 RepID=UPI003B5124BA